MKGQPSMCTLDVKARRAGIVVLHAAVLDPSEWNRLHAVKTTGRVHAKVGKIRWRRCGITASRFVRSWLA